MRHTLVFFSMLVCGLSGCFATEITSLSDFNNDKVITVRRRPVEADSCGYLVYSPGTDETPDLRIAVTTATDSTDNNAGWVMYHNTVDDVYYLYNLGAQKCATITGTNCTFGDSATPISATYLRSKQSWVLTGGGYMAGLSTGRRNAAYFLDSMSADDYGFFFIIQDAGRKLSDSETATMNDAVNAVRLSKIESYRQFLATAKSVNADGRGNYCGGYDVAELEASLQEGVVETVPLSVLEELKQAAIASALPTPEGYYRIKNYERPQSGNHNNYMTLKANGTQMYVQNTTSLGTSNQSSNGDNLRLFQFTRVDGMAYDRARIRMTAVDKGLSNVPKDGIVTMVDNEEGSIFEIVRQSDSQRLFKFKYNNENKRLTTNGVNGGQTIAVNTVEESAMLWYIEKVETFQGPTLDANGYATATLPCAVEIPDMATPYYVGQVNGSKASLVQIAGQIPAYTPFLLKGEPGTQVVFNIHYPEEQSTSHAPAKVGITGNLLSGNTAYLSSSETVYKLSAGSDGTDRLVKDSSNAALSANSAYIIAADVATTADELVFEISGDIVTGVTLIDADDSSAETPKYDVTGRQVPAKQHGLVIGSNGKKTINH